MKKFTAVLFALILMLALCVAVSAADATLNGAGNSEGNVIVTVTQQEVYCVVIGWPDLTFNFTRIWNPEYLDYTNGSWTPASKTINIANKSSVATVNYQVTGQITNDDFNSVSVLFNGQTSVTGPLTTENAESRNEEIEVSLTGLPAQNADEVTIGKVTVNITNP